MAKSREVGSDGTAKVSELTLGGHGVRRLERDLQGATKARCAEHEFGVAQLPRERPLKGAIRSPFALADSPSGRRSLSKRVLRGELDPVSPTRCLRARHHLITRRT